MHKINKKKKLNLLKFTNKSKIANKFCMADANSAIKVRFRKII